MLNWQGSGMGVMEMSHRGKEFMSIYKKTIDDLTEVLAIPESHTVMLFQGGASLQNAAIPLNLGEEKKAANYLTTGAWSQKSLNESKKYLTPTEVASGKEGKFTTVPDPSTWNINPEGAYFHYCSNETIHGVDFTLTADLKASKLAGQVVVADMSSNILTRPVDFNVHDVVYAGC